MKLNNDVLITKTQGIYTWLCEYTPKFTAIVEKVPKYLQQQYCQHLYNFNLSANLFSTKKPNDKKYLIKYSEFMKYTYRFKSFIDLFSINIDNDVKEELNMLYETWKLYENDIKEKFE